MLGGHCGGLPRCCRHPGCPSAPFLFPLAPKAAASGAAGCTERAQFFLRPREGAVGVAVACAARWAREIQRKGSSESCPVRLPAQPPPSRQPEQLHAHLPQDPAVASQLRPLLWSELFLFTRLRFPPHLRHFLAQQKVMRLPDCCQWGGPSLVCLNLRGARSLFSQVLLDASCWVKGQGRGPGCPRPLRWP